VIASFLRGKQLLSMYRRGQLALLPALVLAVLVCGCSRKSPGVGHQATSGNTGSVRQAGASEAFNPAWGIDLAKLPGTRFEATLADDVIRVDADTVRHAAKGVSHDHSIYFFDNLPGLREKFVPGRVVLLEGLTFKRVQAVATDGSQLIVGTQDAAITDLYKEANIAWTAPIHFQEIHAQQARARAALAGRTDSAFAWLERLDPRVYAAADENAEKGDEEEEGWKFHFDDTFTPDRLNFTIHLSRTGAVANVTELDADITGKGYVQNFDNSLSMVIHNSKVSQFDFSNKNVNGAVDFDWTVGAPAGPPKDVGEERIKFAPVMKVPFFLGEVPFSLEIGEALLFHPAFSSKLEIAKGAFHVDYNGVTGLKITSGSGGDANAEDASKASAESSIESSTANSPLAAFGVLVAMALPRFELKTGAEEALNEVPSSIAEAATKLLENTTIGHFIKKAVKNKLVPEGEAYFQVILSSTASHSGMLSLVPCQRFGLHVEGQVGGSASALGYEKELPVFKVFTKDIDQPTPPGKICTGG